MKINDRVLSLKRVKASTLRPHPKNWRTHNDAQRAALRAVMAEVGFADAVLCRQLADGSLQIIDGHLRAEELGDEKIPVLVLDVTDAEADKLLATVDPLAAMAGTDAAKLNELLAALPAAGKDFKSLLAEMHNVGALAPGDLAPRDELQAVPKLTVICKSADDQKRLAERLTKAGYDVRAWQDVASKSAPDRATPPRTKPAKAPANQLKGKKRARKKT